MVLGAADTDIMAGADYDGPLTDPADVARIALDGVEKGLIEVVVDEWSTHVKAALAGDPADFCQQLLVGLGQVRSGMGMSRWQVGQAPVQRARSVCSSRTTL
ncbi:MULTISPECIES: hypothetical protein [Streptomyces]|uniref:Uncharacterized protein n=2 Tax=Streptomyces TaxID=1883 RepID=A0A117IWE0_9ACTN|nr:MULTISPECIES: hypothetical protein [Streptomyces]KUH38613.1 hypothetical protein ATE80_12140 [Streptomyces kanasensis]UUS33905.1 hypothetical protein NRO40_25800 [Streptomyces changanensis]